MVKSVSLSNVSLVIPSRDNLKYLKWCYDSIRKNIGFEPYICLADDASKDGTWEWICNIRKNDKKVKALKNSGPKRKGHTILYDQIITELVETDYAIISHADIYWARCSIENMLKHINKKVIVSATRIEPPLHPSGPEKIIKDFGIEPEMFNEKNFIEYVDKLIQNNLNTITDGVFAPWLFNVEDFKIIGGHDSLFAPQSKEDSDIWNRFLLYGIKFIQSRDAFVYHMTCRGSRFNPFQTEIGKNSSEWEKQNAKSTRNFIRKWGSTVKHDAYLFPEVLPKYNIGAIITNCDINGLKFFEPFFNAIYADCDIEEYILSEQQNTVYDLNQRVYNIENFEKINKLKKYNIILEFDLLKLNQNDILMLTEISKFVKLNETILLKEDDSQFVAGNVKFKVVLEEDSLPTFEYKNIHLK